MEENIPDQNAVGVSDQKIIEPSSDNQLQSPQMEVHHHSHSATTGKKKFKEYFLEFLMIFLAVTMGFFAESLREHINDSAKEKEYLSSLQGELRYDTSEYTIVLKKIFYLRPILDSLFLNVTQAGRFDYVLKGKWNTPINETRITYMPTLATIEQLKSSGNLRLIQSKPILKKILEYETFVRGTMQNEETTITAAVEKIYAREDDMCNESEFNEKTDKNMQDSAAQYSMENGSFYEMPLVVKDPVKLNEFANCFINYKSRNWGYYTNTNRADQIAIDLIQLINKEYHFENE